MQQQENLEELLSDLNKVHTLLGDVLDNVFHTEDKSEILYGVKQSVIIMDMAFDYLHKAQQTVKEAIE